MSVTGFGSNALSWIVPATSPVALTTEQAPDAAATRDHGGSRIRGRRAAATAVAARAARREGQGQARRAGSPSGVVASSVLPLAPGEMDPRLRHDTLSPMRIATWNVNSLKARQEAVEIWLGRAKPDILLMQETKLGDGDAPVMAFAMAGYQLVHHGEGRWNGVAIAARDGLAMSDVVTNFGDGPVRDSGPGGLAADASEDDFDPFDEARMVAATVDGLRLVSRLRAERARRRLAVLRGQAGLVRAARALARRRGRGRPWRHPRRRRRLQRRPDRSRRLGSAAPPTVARTCRSRSVRPSRPSSTAA